MSRYLVDRVHSHPRIAVSTQTEVSALHGDGGLAAISLSSQAGELREQVPCHGLFCFIGAQPATEWLSSCTALDADGFVLTDTDLGDDLPEAWRLLGRRPLPFETSVPAVFAVGDVRHGSMKRVAAAVGEGASAIRSVHQAIAAPIA
jgi:thioredoxin reductase (NADPH)